MSRRVCVAGVGLADGPKTPGLSALMLQAQAFGRAVAFVVRRPIAIAHVLLWGAAFLAVSVLFAWAAFGHAMLGASGAIALTIIREGVSLVRMGLKVALVGGQVELGASRKPPARATQEAA